MRARRHAGARVITGIALALAAFLCEGCVAAGSPSDSATPIESLSEMSGEWVYSSQPEIWLAVADSGEVTGSRGCTPFSSTVSIEAGSDGVRFGEFSSDGVSCGDALDGAWDELAKRLDTPRPARISGETLLIGDLEFIRRAQ